MATVYIGIILIARVVQAIFSKRSSNEIKGISHFIKYTAFSLSVSAILGLGLIIASGNGFKIDFLTFIIGTFSGLSLFFANFCNIYGMKTGTVSVNSMFATAGMLVPLISGIVLFGQPINLMQWIGVLIFFVSAFLLIQASKEVNNKFNIKTLLLLIGSLVSNGATMLAQQFFAEYVPNGDVSVFSFISFGIVALASGILVLFSPKSDEAKSENLSKNLIICAIALAAAVFLINQLATISASLVTPVILFTFINGGGTIISTIVAAVMYKEKLNTRTVLGVLIGILSLVIIKIF